MIGSFFGPINGNRHDSYMLTRSGLVRDLKAANHRLNRVYAVYGDPAYPRKPEMQRPHKGLLTDDQKNFNKDMSSGRVTVEWGFGLVVKNWSWVDYRHSMKVLETAVQVHVECAVILQNCLTIFNGNQMQSHFNCYVNLALEEYFRK